MRMPIQGGIFRTGRWFFLLWLLLLQGVAAAEIPFGNGLLFRIQKAGAEPSYLFGTIHLEDRRVVNLPEPVRSAFDGSRRVVLEMTLDGSNIFTSVMSMIYMDGRELRNVVGEELYLRAVAAMEIRGVPEVALRRYKPWSVATLLIVPPAETGQFLDFVLYQTAQAAGKPVLGLETAEEQLQAFDEMPEDAQIKMLEETLDNLDQVPAMLSSMVDAYLDRDLAGLVRINEAYQEGSDPKLVKLFQERLIDDRNRRMAERLHPMLEEGGVFVGVGALHLPGEKGILNLLKTAGYKIEVVY